MNEASEQTHLKSDERRDAQDRSGPESLVLYQAMVLKGERELARPTMSLFWSGFVAGLAISVSLIAEGALHQRLPLDAQWRLLVTGFGYSVGFLIVILGRLQLFTEHTVVAVLPAVAVPSLNNLQQLGRLWTVVFVANQLGALVAAISFGYFGITSPELTTAMVEVSEHLLHRSFMETLLLGVPAGFIIGTVAWLIVASKSGHFWLITLLTYVIAIGGFSHVIASAVGAYLLALTGHAPPLWPIGGFVLPALIGNIIGGSGLFALLAFAQIREEI